MRARDEAEIVACVPGLRRYARGLTGDGDRADDLVQDTLERPWARFSMWQKRGDLRAWLFGIMHNHFVDRLRAQRARPEDAAGDELPDPPQRATQADRLPVRDPARALGVPVGTVMSRLSRGRERLRVELQGRDAASPAARMQRVK